MTGFSLEAMRLAISEIEGNVGDQVKTITKVTETAVSEADTSALILCARLGAQDTTYQVRVREGVENMPQVKESLKAANDFVNSTGTTFLGGSQPNGDDAALFSGLYTVFGLLYKPEHRAQYPSLDKWFSACLSTPGLGDKCRGGDHSLGLVRAGGQIDLYGDSLDVRANADRAAALNQGYKKKKTQRQLEKEAKAKAKVAEEESKKAEAESVAKESQFKTKVPADASVDEKIAAVRAAIKQVGGDGDACEVLKHAAATSMDTMPEELRTKDGIVCKNLFMKGKKPRKEGDSCLWVITVPEKAKVNYKEISKALGYKKEIRQAPADLLGSTMNLMPGSVTPLGILNDSDVQINILLDEKTVSNPDTILWVHPLTNEATMGVKAGDLLKIIAASGRKEELLPFEIVE